MEINLPLIPLIIAVPFIGMFFAFLTGGEGHRQKRNLFNMAFFTILFNLFCLFVIFKKINASGFYFTVNDIWLETPLIAVGFGIDLPALILILTTHIVFLIGFIASKKELNKLTVAFSLMFLGLVTGFFSATDIFSFYVFFDAMLFPLLMLIGMNSITRKQDVVSRFFIYNLIGSLFLFICIIVIYNYKKENVLLKDVGIIIGKSKFEVFLWSSVFISFLSRIPVWPFHYWISSTNVHLKNPLVFITVNLIPLTAIYGFVRFLPSNFAGSVYYFSLFLEIISVISMLFIALMGLVRKDSSYKLFSYITVYYIFYLISVLHDKGDVNLNICYSLFAVLLLFASLVLLHKHIDDARDCEDLSDSGILCFMPRLSKVYSFLSLAAAGLPLSALFFSNYILLSGAFGSNIYIGILIALTLIIIAMMLLEELYKLKDYSHIIMVDDCSSDISVSRFVFLILIVIALLLSFIWRLTSWY